MTHRKILVRPPSFACIRDWLEQPNMFDVLRSRPKTVKTDGNGTAAESSWCALVHHDFRRSQVNNTAEPRRRRPPLLRARARVSSIRRPKLPCNPKEYNKDLMPGGRFAAQGSDE